MKIIAYILAAILLILGVLFVIAAFGPAFNPGWFAIGGLMVVIGLALVWFGTRQKAGSQANNVTVKIDLPGNVNLDSFQCKNCGGALTTDNVKLVAGAPVVTCPYCNTTYQLTEEPKW
ncbi:MAG: hypothetical protein MUE67_04550 [Anaerolineales bacterium]|jgi:cytochrome c biogenesis factor|nr:hypothetical protein [Anaerolineales bacterium]